VEPKVRRRARASSRGEVWRKPNPKMRGDEQEPDMRCGILGTSGHVTAKSSIHNWSMLYKSGVYALKATCLTPGGLPYANANRLRLSMAEGRAIDPDRMAEVSRGHSNPVRDGMKARTVPDGLNGRMSSRDASEKKAGRKLWLPVRVTIELW